MAIASTLGWYSLQPLIEIAKRWAELGYMEQAFSAARSVQIQYYEIEALINLIPYQQEEEIPSYISKIREQILSLQLGEQLQAYIHLIPYLTATEQSAIASTTLSLSQAREPNFNFFADPDLNLDESEQIRRAESQLIQSRSKVAIELLPYLPESEKLEIIPEIIEASESFAQPQDRTKYLSKLIDNLVFTPRNFPRNLLRIANRHIEIYIALACRLAQQGYYEESIGYARSVVDVSHRVTVLAKLVPHVPAELRTNLLEEILTYLQAIEDEKIHSEILIEIAQYLGDSQLVQAFEIAKTISYESLRAGTLSAIGVCSSQPLKGSVLDTALNAARAIKDEYWQVETLMTLVTYLSDSDYKARIIDHVYELSQRIKRQSWRAKSFALLSSHIVGPQLTQVCDAGLQAVENCGDHDLDINSFALLAENLPPSLHQRAEQVAYSIQNNLRAHLLIILAANMNGSDQTRISRDALREILPYGSFLQLQLLEYAFPIIPDSMLREVMEFANQLPEQVEDIGRVRYPYVEALISTAFRLPESERLQQLREALILARNLGGDHYWIQIFSTLQEHLPELQADEAIDEALNVAEQIENELSQAAMQAQLSFYLPGSRRTPICNEVLEKINSTRGQGRSHFEIVGAINSILPFLPVNTLSQVQLILNELPESNQKTLARIALAMRFEGHEKERLIQDLASVTLQGSNFFERRDLLTNLIPLLLETESVDLNSLLPQILTRSAKRGRQALLVDLQFFAPVILRLGGTEAIVQTAEAVKEVNEWWP